LAEHLNCNQLIPHISQYIDQLYPRILMHFCAKVGRFIRLSRPILGVSGRSGVSVGQVVRSEIRMGFNRLERIS